ncbi:transcriptional regulator, partial [Enterobacter hormaechei]
MRDLILQLSKSSIYSTKPLRGHHPHSALAAVTMKYLNEKKTLAVVQVDYR